MYECIPLYDVATAEFVVLRSEIIGSKRLILPWISSCPGWRNGSALARKARGPSSIPGPGYNFSLSNFTTSQHMTKFSILHIYNWS